jgi:hypothetical protein
MSMRLNLKKEKLNDSPVIPHEGGESSDNSMQTKSFRSVTKKKFTFFSNPVFLSNHLVNDTNSRFPAFAGNDNLRKIIWLALISLLLFNACAVKQYQREHLSDPIMQLEEDQEVREMEQHLLERREGSSGGQGASGGGCGC